MKKTYKKGPWSTRGKHYKLQIW